MRRTVSLMGVEIVRAFCSRGSDKLESNSNLISRGLNFVC